MLKKKLAAILLIFGVIPLGVLLIVLLGMWQDVQKLKDHYPVFDKKKADYVLVNKKPKHWISVNKISKVARWAIIVSEDWAFYEHEGLDTRQLFKVIEESYEAGEFVRGASTITQQVIKNALLGPQKTLTRKVKEMIMATMLEKTLTKDQILEHYLNLIELGEDIYGVRAGARLYFQKHPAKLNAKEGAFLAMLLPSPIRYSQSYRNQKLTPFAHEQINDILVKLRQANIINEAQREAASREVLSFESINYFGEDFLDVTKEFE